jgi:hypothetical protein
MFSSCWVRAKKFHGALLGVQVSKDVCNKFVFDVPVAVDNEAIVA